MKNRINKVKIQKSRYAMHDFIESVEAQTVIWQRDHDSYYNREKREEAWYAVARRLNAEFDKFSEDQKRRTVESLTRRWKNTRDCYFRTLRNDSQKKYIYEEKMSFLLSNNPPKCSRKSRKTHSFFDDDDDDDDGDDENTGDHNESSNDTINKKTIEALETKPTMDVLLKTRKRLYSTQLQEAETAKKHKQQSRSPNTASEASNNTDPLLLVQQMKISCDERSMSPQYEKFDDYAVEEKAEVRSPNNSNIPVVNTATIIPSTSIPSYGNIQEPDPDQAFFDSIKPVMRGMNMNQKLDFQIEVLKLLKIYRKSQ